MSLIQQLVVN